MACLIDYKSKFYNEDDFKVVASLHEFVKSKLKEGQLFKQFKNKLYYSKDNVNKINKEFKRIKEINDYYKSNVISINRATREVVINVSNVAPVFIEEYRKTGNNLINQSRLFQLKAKEESPNERLNSKLKDFLSKNGISVKYVDSLLARTGQNAVAVYDTIEKSILIASNKEDSETLPEETGHAIIETLGKDHPLIKALLFNVTNIDYKSFLDKEYIDLYQNNESLLIREAAGKILGMSLKNKFESPSSRLKEIIGKIINLFKKMFNLPINDFRSSVEETFNLANKVAEKVLNEEKFESLSGFQTLPDNRYFYRLESNKDKKQTNPEQEEFKRKKVYFNNVLKRLSREHDSLPEGKEKEELAKKITDLTLKLEQFKEEPSNYLVQELATPILILVRDKIEEIEKNEVTLNELSANDILFTVEALNQFKNVKGIANTALELEERINPIVDKWVEKTVNEFATESEELTIEDINTEEEDINRYRRGFGALADVGDYLGRTIGSMIKKTQNRITSFNKQISKDVEDHVKELKTYQTSRGISEKDMYNIFIQEAYGTTILTTEFTSEYYTDKSEAITNLNSGIPEKILEGRKWFDNLYVDEKLIDKYKNKNFDIIQNTPELKKFYDFYDTTIREAFDKLPVTNKNNFIPNIRNQSITDIIKSKGMVGALKEGVNNLLDIKTVNDWKADEDLLADVVPLRYISKLQADKKSNDLGASLLTFASFANSHYHMSDILPQTRLLQEKIKDKNYVKSNNPGLKIRGEESNIFALVDDYIKMQVKGQSKDPLGKIIEIDTVDDKGKPVKKIAHVSTLIDIGLRYNSLLRIGFNPFNAVTNVIIGDITNAIEGFGGRFFNNKELAKASSIFFQQINNEESKLVKILEILNPLQELEDYEAIDKVKLKGKFNSEKLKNFLYLPQKKGESFLQVRTMVASMLHDKITDKDGNEHSLWEAFDEKGEWKKDLFGELDESKIGKMSDKIQRINQMIHGRYSSRDTAAWSQNAVFRAAFQFRKWIPAALEARFAGYQYDNRLGEYVEGRWRTLGKLVKEGFSPGKRSFMDMISSLMSTKRRLEKGGLTELEIANIRKDLVEMVLIGASILLAATILDDDWQKKNKKLLANPSIKFGFDQLTRVSGDLIYFANPKSYTELAKNSIPLAKTTGDIISTFMNIGYAFGGEDAIYEKGARKGENKFWSRLGSLIPVNKPITDVMRLWNDEPYTQPKEQ